MSRSRLPLFLLGVTLLAGPAFANDDVDQQVERIERHAREPFEQKQREKAIRALGRLGGKPAARALVPLYDDPFVHIHDHATSAWIAMLKGDNAPETQTWTTGKALKDRNASVRTAAWTALGLTGGAELEDVYRVHAKSEKDGIVLRAIAESALDLRAGADLAGVFPARFDHKDGAAVNALARAAARYDGADAIKALGAVLRHRDPLARAGAVVALMSLDALSEKQVQAVLADKRAPPRIALAESLALRTKTCPWPGAGEAVWTELLAADDWRVRAAAIQGGLRVWDARIVEPLIQRLEVEHGRLKEDAQRALETFTGHTLAVDADLWRSWWSRRKDAFEPPARPAPDAHGRIAFRDAHDRPDDDSNGTVSFFELPLYSKRIVFVFDLSGSFRDPASDVDGAPTKLELLQTEMETTLAGLSEDTRFDLLVYRYPSEYPPKPKLTRAFGKLQPATKGNVKKARAWLGKQHAKGWGAFVEPLESLLGEDVETAVLLSDGRPSRGRLDRDWRILQELPQTNRYAYLAVNTVLIGDRGADRKFMQALADATGGRFREAVIR